MGDQQENAVLRSVAVRGFRSLNDFTMEGLGRVNLLVGTNNCGKTSVLEAVNFLLADGEPWPLWSALYRRGEDVARPQRVDEMDVSHLFKDHVLEAGSRFTVDGRNDGRSLGLKAEVVFSRAAESAQAELAAESGEPIVPAPPGQLALDLQWTAREKVLLPLTGEGGLKTRAFSPSRRLRSQESPSVRFITTESLMAQEVIALVEDVILTEDEGVLIGALQSIEPGIERIATVSGRDYDRYAPVRSRGGVVAKLKGVNARVPFGSLGDGMWRMLGIALSLVRARGGALLIDEIDTGLHYTVMADMWRFVAEVAQRLDIQVFATSHSRDCYQSLAAIVQRNHPAKPEVSIQRIERDKKRTVAFTDEEIAIAADSDTEVR